MRRNGWDRWEAYKRQVRAGKMKVFSGVQPSGILTIGNYLGAIRHFVRLQERAECLFCIVDLHALTVPRDPEDLRRDTRTVANLYLACGLRPERAVLFAQSHVPEHAQLCWLLGCLAKVGELRRMTQFKDKSHGGEVDAGFGLFAYPVLMAADILLYRATHVPVGDDQRQHLELCRDLAQRFNARFGEFFPVPEPLIAEVGARVMGLDDPTRKMSKSEPNPSHYISLLDPPDVIRDKIRRAVTDSGREVRLDWEAKPAISNLLEIFSLMAGEPVAALEARYGSEGYARFKRDLAEAVVAGLSPIQERFADLAADPAYADRVLREGAERAHAQAAPLLAEVKERMGLLRAR
jgi:tryptophanyl-tRNA synthetase